MSDVDGATAFWRSAGGEGTMSVMPICARAYLSGHASCVESFVPNVPYSVTAVPAYLVH